MKPVKMVAIETIWNTFFQIFLTSTSLQTNALGFVRDTILKNVCKYVHFMIGPVSNTC